MLVLPAELMHEHATACARMLVQSLRAQADTAVVADVSALQRFDSSALAVLLECRREALAAGKTFAVKGLPDKLAGLSRLYGVDALLPAAG